MRYILFVGDIYYASGGGNDFSAMLDDKDELEICAKTFIGSDEDRWWNIFDTVTLKVISGTARQACGFPESEDDSDFEFYEDKTGVEYFRRIK